MPATSLTEPFQKPTTLRCCNLLAMKTEALLRAYPADGHVPMAGCDKTTPALPRGAVAMGLPVIFVPAGPMLRGDWRSGFPGAGSDTRKCWVELRADRIGERDWQDVEAEPEDGSARSAGHCVTTGTASATTNAIVRPVAMAQRCRIALALNCFDEPMHRCPVEANRRAAQSPRADPQAAW